MKDYSVWITLYGTSAKNAGIIGSQQHTRSKWTDAGLIWIPINDGTQQHYEFAARSVEDAFERLTKLFQERNPHNRKPLSGKSYLRACQVK